MNNIIFPKQFEYLTNAVFFSDPLLNELKKFAEENNVPVLNEYSAKFLEIIIESLKPSRVLEIGTAIAYSSIIIASKLDGDSKLFTIEKSENNINIAQNNIISAGLTDRIELLKGEAKVIMPSIAEKFDLIFLDADKEDYIELFDLSIPLLKKGGVLFVDNLLWHGFAALKKTPKKYKRSAELIRVFNKKFRTAPYLNSIILPIGDGIGFAVKRS